MADNLDNLSAWRLVLALGRTGSLTQAAVAADIELSAASRLLASLEKSLGIQLVDRKTKPMRFHPNAKPLLSKIEEMLDLHRDLIEQADRLSESEARITIRFSVPTNIARRFFVLLMDRYKQEVDPNVEFEFFSNLDHVDVQNGLVDMAMLPYCPVNVSGLHVQPFLPATTLIVASPAYLEEHGTPERVDITPSQPGFSVWTRCSTLKPSNVSRSPTSSDCLLGRHTAAPCGRRTVNSRPSTAIA